MLVRVGSGALSSTNIMIIAAGVYLFDSKTLKDVRFSKKIIKYTRK